MKTRLSWLMAGWLCACTGTEGPLLYRRAPVDGSTSLDGSPSLDGSTSVDGSRSLDGSPSPDGGSTATSSPLRAAIRQNMTLQYQITGALNLAENADLFVVDLFGTTSAQVAQLHAARRIVIAYVSVGTREPWRDDADQFPRAAIGNALPNYPDESWLDIRNTEVRRVMRARFERAVAKGFDGLFASTVGAYRQTNGLSLTRADELDYHAFLTSTAHELALAIGLSGDFELSTELAGQYDFAIATRCVARDTCGDLGPLQARGVPVFDLETDGDRASVCSRAMNFQIPVIFKTSRFDATRSVCP
jgi:hypothetical protein